MNDWRPVTSMIRSRMLSPLASARARYSAAVFIGSACMRARPWMIDVELTSGSMSGSGPSASYADRSRFQTCSRSRIAVCGLTCWRRMWWAFSAASAAVSPSTYVAAGMIFSSSRERP